MGRNIFYEVIRARRRKFKRTTSNNGIAAWFRLLFVCPINVGVCSMTLWNSNPAAAAAKCINVGVKSSDASGVEPITEVEERKT